MRMFGGKACDKAMDLLPIPDDLRDDAKIICKAAVGGPIGAIFHISKIGPEPDKSTTYEQRTEQTTEHKKDSNPTDKAKNSSSSSFSSDRMFFDRDNGSRRSENMSRELTRDERKNETFDSWLSRRK